MLQQDTQTVLFSKKYIFMRKISTYRATFYHLVRIPHYLTHNDKWLHVKTEQDSALIDMLY